MNKTKGFAHLILIIAVFIIAVGGIGYSIYRNSKAKNQEQKTSETTTNEENQNIQNESGGNNEETTPTSKITPTIKTTAQPTKKPTTPTGSTSSTTSCPYGTGSTGAVKVNIQAQSGILVGDQTVELKAQTGCNVLILGNTDTRIARQGSPSVDFSSVPPGPYSVRAQYKGQWTSYQNITVNSGQQTTTTITVSGDTLTNTPTPTPKPKPTCYNPIIYPSSTGTAPYSVILQPQGAAGAAGSMTAYEWDYTGDGSWDSTGSLNAQNYTYQNPGTYTVKIRVLASNGEYSDICQSTVTVN